MTSINRDRKTVKPDGALAEVEPYAWTWQSCENSQGWNTKFGDTPPKPGPWISDVMPLYTMPVPRPAEPEQGKQE